MIFLDTESVGLFGPPISIQHSSGENDYQYFPVWERPVKEFLFLVEKLLEEQLIIFNASHEAFVLTKWWNIFSKCKSKELPPVPEEIREIEEHFDYSKMQCLQPKSVIDLYIICKQTIFSFAAGREKRAIEIKDVPFQAVKPLKNFLEIFAVQLPKILFDKFKSKMPGEYWEVTPSKKKGFVNFKLNFAPSLKLKSIIKFLFPEEKTQEIEIQKYHQPDEEKKEFRPWNDDWPRLLATHLKYWKQPRSLEYARKDIIYLQWLKNVLQERNVYPQEEHIDSCLAWHSGSSKAKGFCIDNEQLDILLTKARVCLQDIPDTSSQASLAWLREVCPPEFQWLIQNTDTKKTLIPLSKNTDLPEVSERAKLLIAQRGNRKRIDTLTKLQSVGRFHPSFEISGTLSGRMSGQGGINPQGIIRALDFREVFLMADEDRSLSGGDFSSQEITILDAVVPDPKLHALIKEKPKKIHELMAWCLYSQFSVGKDSQGKDIWEWEPRESWEPEKQQYYDAKQCVYALLYGSQLKTFAKTAKLSEEQAQRGMTKFLQELPCIGEYVEGIKKDFASMKQPNGLGTVIEWHDPAPYCTSIFGFSRNYILDNQICKFLFNLANNPPSELKYLEGRVVRKDREQSVVGAIQSSLYATAFQIQAENLRTAGNHKIQSPGATVTKILQYHILLLQPIGIAPFLVQLYNVHDELLCVNDCPDLVEETVKESIGLLRQKIPLLNIDWKPDIGSWAEVK